MSMSGPQEYDLEFITDHVRDMTEHFLKNCRCVPTTRRPDRRKKKRKANRLGAEKRARNRMLPLYRTNRESPAYDRITRAGFTIKEPVARPYQVMFFEDSYGVHLLTDFVCVCGTEEAVGQRFTAKAPSELRYFRRNRGMIEVDIAQVIEDLDGVSVEHLRSDGYSEEEIKRIRAPYAEQDALQAHCAAEFDAFVDGRHEHI